MQVAYFIPTRINQFNYIKHLKRTEKYTHKTKLHTTDKTVDIKFPQLDIPWILTKPITFLYMAQLQIYLGQQDKQESEAASVQVKKRVTVK